MTTAFDLLIERATLDHTRISTGTPTDPTEGEVLLRIDLLAMTANNITYAVFGEALRYWQFFPADAGWGRLPAWGFADVIESQVAGIAAGQRYYGFFPAASHLVVRPARVHAAGFIDAAAHRKGLPLIYNQYLDCAHDPLHAIGSEAIQALLRPLFTTSFLIAHSLLDRSGFDATAVLLTSASSKTALGTAFALREAGSGLTRLGLTSAANRIFVEQSGLYDQVLTYEDLTGLGAWPSVVSIDFAGNSSVLSEIHQRCGQTLRHSWLVGGAHWTARSGGASLVGPRPELFFAPSVAEQYLAQWGTAQFQQRLVLAWNSFVGFAADQIEVHESAGPVAVQQAYLQLLNNAVAANAGLIVRP